MSFKAMQAWKYLCRNPHVHGRQVAEHFGWKLDNCAKTIQWLVRHGCVRAEGNSHMRRYRATEIIPMDGRGASLGSQMALKTPENYMENLAKANAKKAQMAKDGTLRFKKRNAASDRIGAGVHILDQCWNFSSRIEHSTNSLSNATKGRRGPSCVETPEDKEAA